MIKVLVIKNEPGSALDVSCKLEENGFEVEAVPAGTAAAELRSLSFALIVCELAAAGSRGTADFLKERSAPVLWLARTNELPKMMDSFYMGFEDYVVCPVSTTELLTRVGALMHCAGINLGRRLCIGSLILDADAHLAVAGGAEVPLTVREFNILFGLLPEPERVFTRKELMRRCWGEDSGTSPRAVDVYMTKLRDKFASCRDFRIVTVYGKGYKAMLS